jgi:DNA-binding transcriptional regulator GbsR (MarR family)
LGAENNSHTPDEDLLRFVERFALMLTDAGMPRMPARVFAYVMAEDAERYTAAELAEGLRVSRAAISGAVRYLVHSGLLGKEREPGARTDHYRIYDDDIWATINRQRLPILHRWEQGIAGQIDLLGPDSRGGRRMRETQAYFRFMSSELPKLNERWRDQKDALIKRIVEEERNP